MNLQTSLGTNWKKYLEDLVGGVLRSEVMKNISKRTVAGDDDDAVACDHVEKLGDGSVRSKLVLKLANAPRGGANATKTRSLSLRMNRSAIYGVP